MQSSHHTTNVITADMIYNYLNYKMKKISSGISSRKLVTGEYVLVKGRVIPASVVKESKNKTEKSTR